MYFGARLLRRARARLKKKDVLKRERLVREEIVESLAELTRQKGDDRNVNAVSSRLLKLGLVERSNAKKIAYHVEVEYYEKDAVIYNQGDAPNGYYLIASGEVRGKTGGFGSDFSRAGKDLKRTETVISDGCALVLIPSRIYVTMMTVDSQLQRKLNLLEGSLLFEKWPVDRLYPMAYETRLQAFESEATIAREGDPFNAVIIVASGTVKVSINKHNGLTTQPVDVAVLPAGEIFGIVDVIRRLGCYRATVTATSDCDIAFLQLEAFRKALHDPQASKLAHTIASNRERWETLRTSSIDHFLSPPLTMTLEMTAEVRYLAEPASVLEGGTLASYDKDFQKLVDFNKFAKAYVQEAADRWKHRRPSKECLERGAQMTAQALEIATKLRDTFGKSARINDLLEECVDRRDHIRERLYALEQQPERPKVDKRRPATSSPSRQQVIVAAKMERAKTAQETGSKPLSLETRFELATITGSTEIQFASRLHKSARHLELRLREADGAWLRQTRALSRRAELSKRGSSLLKVAAGDVRGMPSIVIAADSNKLRKFLRAVFENYGCVVDDEHRGTKALGRMRRCQQAQGRYTLALFAPYLAKGLTGLAAALRHRDWEAAHPEVPTQPIAVLATPGVETTPSLRDILLLPPNCTIRDLIRLVCGRDAALVAYAHHQKAMCDRARRRRSRATFPIMLT